MSLFTFFWKRPKEFQVMCGECSLKAFSEADHSRICFGVRGWCPRFDHFTKGKQRAPELFSLECAICIETAAEKFDNPSNRANPQSYPDCMVD